MTGDRLSLTLGIGPATLPSWVPLSLQGTRSPQGVSVPVAIIRHATLSMPRTSSSVSFPNSAASLDVRPDLAQARGTDGTKRVAAIVVQFRGYTPIDLSLRCSLIPQVRVVRTGA